MTTLKRNLSGLNKCTHDLIIIGGGIFGAAAAWEAASRGLSVVLLEKADFSHATSANHFKMVHGGLRYLQHLDLARIRESSRERSAFLRIAPHLVRPLPIVIPTYGNGLKGKAFLSAGMCVYDLLTFDRNRALQKSRQIPPGRFLSRTQMLQLFPGIHAEGLTGGALFHDGQMVSPCRLALSLIRSASGLSARAFNYMQARHFIFKKSCVSGVVAEDLISGGEIEIKARMVLNAAGPWTHHLLQSSLGMQIRPTPTFSRDLAFVVPRKFDHSLALAFGTQSQDSDSVIDRGGRHLFAVPWNDNTLIGVWHKVYKKSPDHLEVQREEIQEFIDEVNTGFPGLNITLEEVRLINTGLTLFGDEDSQKTNALSFGKRSLLIDHEKEDGIKGLMSLIGVRATTSRGMAEKAINMLFDKCGLPSVPSQTDCTHLFGATGPDFDALLAIFTETFGDRLSNRQLQSLLGLYGTASTRVLEYAAQDNDLLNPIGSTPTLRAEIIHAVKDEMALHLDDVVFRRVELATAMLPSDSVLMECANLMAPLLDWDAQSVASEITRTKSCFPDFNYKFSHEASS